MAVSALDQVTVASCRVSPSAPMTVPDSLAVSPSASKYSDGGARTIRSVQTVGLSVSGISSNQAFSDGGRQSSGTGGVERPEFESREGVWDHAAKVVVVSNVEVLEGRHASHLRGQRAHDFVVVQFQPTSPCQLSQFGRDRAGNAVVAQIGTVQQAQSADLRRNRPGQFVPSERQTGDFPVLVGTHAVPLVQVFVAQPVRVVVPFVAARRLVEDLEDLAVGERPRDLHRGPRGRGVVGSRDPRSAEVDRRDHPGRVDRSDHGVRALPSDRRVVDRVSLGVEHRSGQGVAHTDRVERQPVRFDHDLGAVPGHHRGKSGPVGVARAGGDIVRAGFQQQRNSQDGRNPHAAQSEKPEPHALWPVVSLGHFSSLLFPAMTAMRRRSRGTRRWNRPSAVLASGRWTGLPLAPARERPRPQNGVGHLGTGHPDPGPRHQRRTAPTRKPPWRAPTFDLFSCGPAAALGTPSDTPCTGGWPDWRRLR